jgi:hypothetical protein
MARLHDNDVVAAAFGQPAKEEYVATSVPYLAGKGFELVPVAPSLDSHFAAEAPKAVHQNRGVFRQRTLASQIRCQHKNAERTSLCA